MTPFNHIIAGFYGDTSARFGLDAAAVLLLKVMAANYADDMPAGSNPYRWALEQLSVYAPNDFLRHLSRDWHSKANPHI